MVYHSTVSIHHLECKMFFSNHRKERLRFDSMCKFSVLCVLGSVCSVASQCIAEVLWRRRHVECVCVCCVEGFGVRSRVPFCNVMHSTVWWCIWALQLSSNPSNHFAFVHCRTKVRHLSASPKNHRTAETLICHGRVKDVFCNIAGSCHKGPSLV